MGQYYNPTNIDKMQNVYSHDYDEGLKLMEHSYIGNDFVKIVEYLLSKGKDWYKNRFVWAGDYADSEPGLTEDDENHNIYGQGKPINPSLPNPVPDFRYIVNESKEIFVDKDKIQPISKNDKYKIHPLPLFTCEGNGRGGGDFRGDDNRVGTWARDIIFMTDDKPEPPFTEIDGQFKEDR